jgi:outer membrane protein OmpA-like peptidoglycan-associated protein
MRIATVAALLLSGIVSAFSQGLPPYFTAPANVKINDMQADEKYGEAEFPLLKGESHILAGHHWRAGLILEGMPDASTGKDVWAKFKEALVRGGWKAEAEFDVNPPHVTFHFTKGRDAWAHLWFIGADDIRLDLVEIGNSSLALKLPPPGPKPELVQADSGDFPYLLPFQGSTFQSGTVDPAPFTVQLKNENEPTIVAKGSIVKYYEPPAGISTLEFATVYAAALKSAGWSIVTQVQGISVSDAVLVAHFSKNGRDVWANLHLGADGLAIRVADPSALDDAQTLKNECRLTLTGVFFDFNKSTLKPESDGALTRALNALKANPGISVEVQGHTDAVGDDAYNMKLSDARAKSVLSWLNTHGIPSSRLSAKGYGKTQPVASNDSDEGRARNRRVELVCRK